MKIVGKTTILGNIVPLELPVERRAEEGDVVLCEDQYYRVYDSGKKLSFWNVTQKWESEIKQYVPSGSAMDVAGRGW